MSYEAMFSLWISTLHPLYGEPLYAPILYPEYLSCVSSEEQLGTYIMEEFQTHRLRKGDYSSVLFELPHLEVEPAELSIELTPALLPYLPHSVELVFPVGMISLENGEFLGISPTTKTRAYGTDPDEALKRLSEAIRASFKYQRVRESAYQFLQYLWWGDVSFKSINQNLTFYNSRELEQIREKNKDSWLKKVARKITSKPRYLVGKHNEVKRLQELVASPFKRSIILIGQAGVGKSEIIYQWVKKDQDIDVWETDALTLISKLTTQFGWQTNLNHLIRELERENALLYIKRFADLFEVGRSVGQNLSLGEVIRDEIRQNKIRIITECTEQERALLELRYPDLLSAYYTLEITVPEPSELVNIVSQKGNWLCKHSPLEFIMNSSSVDEIISLHQRFSPYSSRPAKLIYFIQAMINRLISNDTSKAIHEMTSSGFSMSQALDALRSGAWKITPNQIEIDRELTVKLFCEEHGLPQELISSEHHFDLEKCRAFFTQNIFGQADAIQVVVDCISTIKSGLSRQGLPLASMLFVGSTGVGKTEMVKVLADYLFSSRERVIRFDMSEFSDPINVLRLTGLHRGEEGILTSAIRDQPFSVILFDEIEKAHPDFFDLLLQILGAGRLTSRSGETVDFCSALIVMTSNLGANDLKRGSTGFNRVAHNLNEAQQSANRQVQDHFERAVRRALRPELYNRIGHIVPFLPLNRSTMREVLTRELKGIQAREGISFRGHQLKLTDQALHHLGELGYSERYGARQVQRAVREHLIYPLARKLNQEKLRPRYIEVEQVQNAHRVFDELIQHSDAQLLIDMNPIEEIEFHQQNRGERLLSEEISLTRKAVYALSQHSDWRDLSDILMFIENDLSQIERDLIRLEKIEKKQAKAQPETKNKILLKQYQKNTHSSKTLRVVKAMLLSNQHLLHQVQGAQKDLYQELCALDTKVMSQLISPTSRNLEEQQTRQEDLKLTELSQRKRLHQLRHLIVRQMIFMYYYQHREQSLVRLSIYGQPQDICTLARYSLTLAQELGHVTTCEPIWTIKSFDPLKSQSSIKEFEMNQKVQSFLMSDEFIDHADSLDPQDTLLGLVIEFIGIGAHTIWRSMNGTHELKREVKKADDESKGRCLVKVDHQVEFTWGKDLHERLIPSSLTRDFYHDEAAIQNIQKLYKILNISVDGFMKSDEVKSDEVKSDKNQVEVKQKNLSDEQGDSLISLLTDYHQSLFQNPTWSKHKLPKFEEIREELIQLKLSTHITHSHSIMLTNQRDVRSYLFKDQLEELKSHLKRHLNELLIPQFQTPVNSQDVQTDAMSEFIKPIFIKLLADELGI